MHVKKGLGKKMFQCWWRPKRHHTQLPDEIWTEIILFATGNMRQWALLQRVSTDFRRLARTRRALSRTMCDLRTPLNAAIPVDLVSVVGGWTLQPDLLSKFTAVRALYLDHDLHNYEPVAKLHTLHTLCLWNSTNVDKLFENAEFRGLKHLSVHSPHVTDLTVEWLVGFEELETLELEETCITEKGLRRLVELPHLRTLKLSFYQTITTLDAVAQLSSLEELDLTDCELVANWKCLISLHKLTKLDLSLTRVTDHDLAELCTLPALRQLNLFGCQSLTDACMQSLVQFPKLAHANLHCCYRISREVLDSCKIKFPCSQDRW
jgi:internalin A